MDKIRCVACRFSTGEVRGGGHGEGGSLGHGAAAAGRLAGTREAAGKAGRAASKHARSTAAAPGMLALLYTLSKLLTMIMIICNALSSMSI